MNAEDILTYALGSLFVMFTLLGLIIFARFRADVANTKRLVEQRRIVEERLAERFNRRREQSDPVSMDVRLAAYQAAARLERARHTVYASPFRSVVPRVSPSVHNAHVTRSAASRRSSRSYDTSGVDFDVSTVAQAFADDPAPARSESTSHDTSGHSTSSHSCSGSSDSGGSSSSCSSSSQ